MFFESQENDIIAQLTSYINDVNVEIQALPEKEADFTRVFEKAGIAVCYSKSGFDKPATTSPIIYQGELEEFQVMIRATKLRGTNGIYELADKVRKALVGFKPSQCQEGMYLTKFHFQERAPEKEFIYMMVFEVMSMVVQEYNPPADPSVSSITFN